MFHYTTDEVHLFGLFFPKIRVTAECVRGVVGGHSVLCGVIHPCHAWSMPHITLIHQGDSISIYYVSLSLEHYSTDEVHFSSSWVRESGVTAEHVQGVVGGYDVVYGVIHPSQTWPMHHIYTTEIFKS